MTNGDREGQSFLSHPHTNYAYFFLLTTASRIYVTAASIQRVSISFFIFTMVWLGLCEIIRIQHESEGGIE